ncbi:Eco57I restriction-modification methylase domain-containing protein [Carnobacteriaceae bacterium 52-44]
MSNLYQTTYNPDVLECLANLSSDEVFTPPEIANKMLDLLPKDIFKNPNSRFLDPASKSGVFLREIAKRLIVGLEEAIPNLYERLDHIYQNQLYGIAITELTSLVSRRSIYYTKYPQTDFSVSKFDNAEGNIIFRKYPHTWKNDTCIYCGATRKSLDRDESLETHAYEFIHTNNPKEIYDMKFDVIIGNPPYQLDDGGAGASAKPIYQLFIQQAMKLNPNYLVMITPSRWFSGGKGLNQFRAEMMSDKRFREIHDFFDASEVFPGVEIKGGVNYFLWDRDYNGDTLMVSHSNGKVVSKMKRPLQFEDNDIVIRYNEAIDILSKVSKLNEDTFSSIVSPRKPFGLATNFKGFNKTKQNEKDIKIYANKIEGWLPNNFEFSRNEDAVGKWKVFMPYAVGSGDMSEDEFKPFIGEPNSVATETYIMVGPFNSEDEAKNSISYIRTKFFHFMVGLRKVTQHATSKVYKFVPIQDFSKPWTDEELYEKYDLSEDEINFIESIVRPFETDEVE